MIRGISDVRRLPRLGKIRLGEKRTAQSGKEYPSKLDHFSFKDVPWVTEVYGDKCKELDIVLPVEDQNIFFAQERKAYRLTGLFCKCPDGDTAVRVRVGVADGSNLKIAKGTILDPEGEAYIKEHGVEALVGEMFELPCAGEDCHFTERKLCKPIGRLLFMLPKVQRFGCYEISTTSFNSMVTLNSYIDAIRGTAGRVSMIPLKLRLVPKQVQVDGKATGIFHLELVYEGTVQMLMGYQGNRKALPAPIPSEALPTTADLDREVPEDLAPHGGAVLEQTLGGHVPESVPPAEQARQALGKVSGGDESEAIDQVPPSDPLDDEPATAHPENPRPDKQPFKWPGSEPSADHKVSPEEPKKPAEKPQRQPKRF